MKQYEVTEKMPITYKLHEYWVDIQHKCNKAKHRDAKERMLDYAHVQIVYLCDACFAEGQKGHTELYKKLYAEGHR